MLKDNFKKNREHENTESDQVWHRVCSREEEIDTQAGKSVQGMREKIKNNNIVIGSNGERRKKKIIYISNTLRLRGGRDVSASLCILLFFNEIADRSWRGYLPPEPSPRGTRARCHRPRESLLCGIGYTPPEVLLRVDVQGENRRDMHNAGYAWRQRYLMDIQHWHP